MAQLPQRKELMDAIMRVMQESEDVLSTSAINDRVADLLALPEELLKIEDANCTGTEYGYRMRWARTELKKKGLIKNIRRGEWAIVTGK